MLLSIFIPTFQRKYKFERLYNKLRSLVTNEIELIVACSSPEYLPVDNQCNVHCYNTKGYSREENYMFGINKCSGTYTVIVEDDDIINVEVIKKFNKLPYIKNPFISLVIYNIINDCKIKENKILSSSEFLNNFYLIFGNTFHWGQCITQTKYLKYYMSYLWTVKKEHNLIQSDEIITMLIAKNSKYVYLNETPFLWIGKGNDNYSWNQNKEIYQRERFLKIRDDLIGKKYFM